MNSREEHSAAIARFIEKMPSFATTTGKVLEICSRADASPNELNRVISLDPVLTGQVLKLINSAYYSLANKVASLTRAITILGTNTVKNMALSTAAIRAVGGVKKSQALPSAKFWRHSLAVGIAAKLLAAMRQIPASEREELFVAGLLHDIGKLPFGDEYTLALGRARKTQRPLVVVENEMLGMNHQEVGRLIAEKWKLNETITSGISYHHDEETPSSKVALVALADVFVNIHEIGSAGNIFPPEEDLERLLAALSIDIGGLRSLSGQLLAEIRRAEVFLEL